MGSGFGLRVRNLQFEVKGSAFMFSGSEVRGWGSGFTVCALKLRVLVGLQELGCRVWCLGLGLGFGFGADRFLGAFLNFLFCVSLVLVLVEGLGFGVWS